MDDLDPAFERAIRLAAKAELRKRARALRASMPREGILARSARIAERLASLPAVRGARTLALFWPIEGRNEVDLRSFDAALRAEEKRVAYPSIDQDTGAMTFRFVEDTRALEERGLGFEEPDPAAEEAASLDVIVVPALQIDLRGHRIGYGKGYYDRTIGRYCPPAIAIGVAFRFQLLAEVPSTEGDVPVAIVVTEDEVVEVG